MRCASHLFICCFLTLTLLGTGIAQAQAPEGAIVGWGQQVDGGDAAQSFTAMIARGTGGGVITLDPTGECSLSISGNVNLDLEPAPGWDGDTAIRVNSDNSCALCVDGSLGGQIDAPETDIVACASGYCFGGDPVINTIINPGSPVMPDPLAYLKAPPIGPDLGIIDPSSDDPTYYPPGYYAGGMNISGSKKVRLGMGGSPGIYVFEGSGNNGGFQTNGDASVIATNVLIYMKSGKLDLGSTGETTITPMDENHYTNATYIGIAVFQARDNTEDARINGTTDMNLQGSYYFPNNLLEVGGIGTALGNQLIAWQLDLHGTGSYIIQYDGRFPSPEDGDIDGDGIGNACDLCPSTLGGVEVDHTGCSLIPGDFDGDGDIDLSDLSDFGLCLSGPSIPHDGSPPCMAIDGDLDKDADLKDLSRYLLCFSGANVLADPQCADWGRNSPD